MTMTLNMYKVLYRHNNTPYEELHKFPFTIDLYPYDVTFVNKYQSRCILGSNGGNRRHIVVDKHSIV